MQTERTPLTCPAKAQAETERIKDGVADRDARYLQTIVEPIRVCASYRPKMGRGGSDGMSLDAFRSTYGADAFYSWFGLDHPLMYAAHKAAGGMTSIYRQIGIGGERLFRAILVDQLGIPEAEASWSYTIEVANGRNRKLSLDGRIPLDKVMHAERRAKLEQWMAAATNDLGVASRIADTLDGPVFEVRQGYKSKDSKRQNADIANAAKAYSQAKLPCVVVLSNQIDDDIRLRYRNEQWVILTGVLGDDPLKSTYAFMDKIIGYDLAGFLERNKDTLRAEIERTLEALLSPE